MVRVPAFFPLSFTVKERLANAISPARLQYSLE